MSASDLPGAVRRQTYNKLVRDRIPDVIRANGGSPATRILDGPEYLQALATKLVEEAQEFVAAEGAPAALEELADVLEVLCALVEAHGITLEELHGLRTDKAAARGGFSERVCLVHVDEVTPLPSAPRRS